MGPHLSDRYQSALRSERARLARESDERVQEEVRGERAQLMRDAEERRLGEIAR
jgi:hypothetical protein